MPDSRSGSGSGARRIGARSVELSPPGTGYRLPRDLLQESSRRLSAACLVWTFLWSLGLFLNNVVGPILSPDKPLDDAWPWPGNPAAFASILVSLGLFGLIRRKRISPARLLDIGLAYEVYLALAIGIVNQWTPNVHGLSWICALVLVHPLIVPHTPGKTLLASMLAASMDLVGMAITGLRGVELPSVPTMIWTYLPNFVCAGLAVFPAYVIRKMGRHVRRARELGSYRLGELLGRGGMGEVHRASHRMLHRPAAIKLIRPEVLGSSTEAEAERLVERFQREAQAAASLGCPHTIQLYDFGVTDEGTFFYVMELLEGIDLGELVRRFGPVPPARAVYLLRQVLESLAEAHAQGLIHRDIKPSNVHSCRLGLEHDFVKVLDFGLVKSERLREGGDVTATAPEITTGTPAFLAPEAAQGSSAVDHRMDLYALGCVAYWLLTGKLVFEAETPMQMILRHVQDEPIPPSRISELEIPPELDRLVLDCLAKKPADRPSDAYEASARLAACPVAEPWTREQAQHWWRLHLPDLAEPVARGAVAIPRNGTPAGRGAESVSPGGTHAGESAGPRPAGEHFPG